MALEKRELDLLFAASKRYIDERLVTLLETNRDFKLTAELTGFERMFLKNTDGGVPLDVSIFRIFLRWFAAQHFVKWEDFGPFRDEMLQFKDEMTEWRAMMELCCENVREALSELVKEVPSELPTAWSFTVETGGQNGIERRTVVEGANLVMSNVPTDVDGNPNFMLIAKKTGDGGIRVFRDGEEIANVGGVYPDDEYATIALPGVPYGRTFTYTIKDMDGKLLATISVTMEAAPEIATIRVTDRSANNRLVVFEDFNYASSDYTCGERLLADHSYDVRVEFVGSAYPNEPTPEVDGVSIDEDVIEFTIPYNQTEEDVTYTFVTGMHREGATFSFTQAAIDVVVESLKWEDDTDGAIVYYNAQGGIAGVNGRNGKTSYQTQNAKDGKVEDDGLLTVTIADTNE